MMQMIAENKSLWRIKNSYQKDSDCDKCLVFWKKMEKDKEDHIRELNNLIKEHLKA
jgi:hypothetical protein